MDDLMSCRDVHMSDLQNLPADAFARCIQRPNRIPDPQIFHNDATARRVDERPCRQTNGTTRKTWLLLLDLNSPGRINRARNEGTLLPFGSRLNLKLICIASQFKENSIQSFMLAIDSQFLFIGEGSDAGEIVTVQNCLEFLLIGLQLRETLLRQGHFIFARDGIEIGIAEEEIRELIENPVFQFGWRKAGRGKCRN